jgi:disulfide bond formation protein DsbB
MSSARPTTSSTMSPTLLAPLLVALAGTWGSLYLSLGLGLKACPLCFYQRTFIMSMLAVLVMGWLVERTQGELYCLLCVPLAIGGLAVAAFHEYLVLAGKLECPLGIFGVGTAPAQSLAVFAALAVVVVWGGSRKTIWIPLGVLLGIVLAWGCITSAPPMPPPPSQPYDKPLDICRPPFRADRS